MFLLSHDPPYATDDTATQQAHIVQACVGFRFAKFRFAKFAYSHRRASLAIDAASGTNQACQLSLIMVSALLYYISARILWSLSRPVSDNHDLIGPLKKGDFDDPAAPHTPCRSYCFIGDRPSARSACSASQSHAADGAAASRLLRSGERRHARAR